MPSRSQSTENGTPTNDTDTIPRGPYHEGTNYLPAQGHSHPDPAWLPYVEANRGDINILKRYVLNNRQGITSINQNLDNLNQELDFTNKQLASQQEQLQRRDVVVEKLSDALNGLCKMQEIAGENMVSSNAGIEKANERLTKVEDWFQSLWYKVERMDENDDEYRTTVRKVIDQIEERSRVDREELEERMGLMEEKLDIHQNASSSDRHEVCDARCKSSTLEEEIRELAIKTDHMVLTSMREKHHYSLRLEHAERMLADQKSESLTLRQEIRRTKEEKEILFAEQKLENDMLKQQMSRMREEFEEFKAQCMHSQRPSMLANSQEAFEEDEW
jgi:chromosome segregation ATPase